jgi:hypothetical protein
VTEPTYYRQRVPTWMWVLLAIVVGLVVIGALLYQGSEWVRRDERTKIGAKVDSTRRIVWPVEYKRLTRERDSLREVLVVRDSIAGASAAAARASIARLRTLLAAKPMTHYDTVLVTAATETANMCTVATNDCDSVRVANVRIRFVADSIHRADTTAARSLLITTAKQSRTIDDLERRPTWGTVHVRTGFGFGAGYAAGYGTCVIRK